jgi:DNA-binding LacI/PurR family transcriptional regulator
VKKTIIDVAKELNLSPSTISKAVNNTGRMRPETRSRILEYVEENGYVAMSNARILSSKKSWTIGVIYSDISLIGFEHPFFSRILQSFKSYVATQGYEIVMIVSKIGKDELSYLEWCHNKKVDGVFIVMGNINNPNIIEVVNSDYPCVSADITMHHLVSVFSDDAQGVIKMIDYSISLGYQKIAIISGPRTSRSFEKRTTTFIEEMNKRNIFYRDQDIIIAKGFSHEDGFEAGLSIAKNPGYLPEIIFVFSDVIAFGVIRGLESKGFNIPKDISVIGYDDIPFAKHFVPSLTTVAQNTRELGERSAKELLLMIEKKTTKNTRINLIPVEIIERESTKKK